MREFPVSRLGKIGIALLLSAAQIAIAAASHHHSSNLLENLAWEDFGLGRDVHEIACRTPKAIHWHADRTIELEPCLACLRQHLVGIQLLPPIRPVIRTVPNVVVAIAWHPVRGVSLDLSARGPPILL